MQDNRTEQIRQRAYAIWQADGFPEGRDMEHWYRAEREINGSGKKATGEAAPPAAAVAAPKKSAQRKTITLTPKTSQRSKR